MKYLIDDPQQLVAWLEQKKPNHYTKLRIHKTLFILYAFYGASYGRATNQQQREILGDVYSYPPRLFPANFEAWDYGPVERNVYDAMLKSDAYHLENAWEPKSLIEKNIVNDFMDEIISQLDALSLFDLVYMTKSHDSWKEAHKNQSNTNVSRRIDNQTIIDFVAENYAIDFVAENYDTH